MVLKEVQQDLLRVLFSLFKLAFETLNYKDYHSRSVVIECAALVEERDLPSLRPRHSQSCVEVYFYNFAKVI